LSTIKVNNIQSRTGNAISFTSGDTITIPSGATFTNSGTVTGNGFGNTGCIRRLSSSASIGSGSWTKLDYASNIIDIGSTYSSGKFQPSVSGLYQINAWNQHEGFVGYAGYAVYINGTSQYEFITEHGSHYSYPSSGINACVNLNGSTDYAEIYVYQNSGSNKTFYEARWSHFSGVLVAENN
jgi:hypothetical protein